MSPLGPLAGFNFMVHPIWSQLGYFKPSHPRSLASFKLLDIGEGCTEMDLQCLSAKDRPQNFLCTPSFCKAPQAALQDPFPAVGPGPPLTGCRWPGLWREAESGNSRWLPCWEPEDSLRQFSSVTQSCLTLCDPVDCSTPGFPVYHQLLEPTQTHVHYVGDAIQPSHPLSSPSPPAFDLSQHQGILQWVGSSHQVAKSIGASASASVLPVNIQDWFPLGWTSWISLQSKGLSRVFSKPQFKSISSSALSFLYSPALTSIHDYWINHSFD